MKRRHRPDEEPLGVLGCIFFAALAAMGLALLQAALGPPGPPGGFAP